VPGYDSRYAVRDVEADANQLAVTFAPSTPVHWPIFVVHGWTADAPTHVLVDGTAVAALSTLDEASDAPWLTVAADLSGPTDLIVE